MARRGYPFNFDQSAYSDGYHRKFRDHNAVKHTRCAAN